MPVDAIGSVRNEQPATPTKSVLSQEDFLRLFLTELNFQDPMEPLNNREFLAQMAQFSNLQLAGETNKQMENLVFMNSTAQSVGLVGRTVTIVSSNGEFTGRVTAVSFTEAGPQLDVSDLKQPPTVITKVRLSQVLRVQD